jgi:hypothetical protein
MEYGRAKKRKARKGLLLPSILPLAFAGCMQLNPPGFSAVEDPKNSGPRYLWVEDAPGGTGTSVQNRMIEDGAPLALYSVVRDAKGRYLADLDVAWSVKDNFGKVSDSSGAETIFYPPTTKLLATISVQNDDFGIVNVPVQVSYSALTVTGLEMWLRAESLASQSVGAELSLWQDLSDFDHDAQQLIASNRPALEAYGASKILHFDGVDDQLDFDSSFLEGSEYTFILVSREEGNVLSISVQSSALTGPYVSSTQSTIGYDSATDSYFEGDVAELLVYSRELSSSELDSLTNYLNEKWGLE